MSVLFSIGEFDYRIINSNYERKAISLISECFAADEPISRYFKLSPTLLAESCINVLDNYLGREISVLCVHRPSQSLCGANISHGYNPDGSYIPFIPSDSHLDSEKSYLLGMNKL